MLCDFSPPRLAGNDEVTVLEVSWPDGSSFTRSLQPGEMNSVVEVAYPKEGQGAALPNDTQVPAEFFQADHYI